MSRQLLLLLGETCVKAYACVDLVIDETLERSFGSKLEPPRALARERALWSRERSVSSPGLRWIVMAVVVSVPWTRATLGLAFRVCAGNHPRRVSERLGKRHKTIAMWAQQMISLLRRWLPDRRIKLLGDSAYSVLELGLHANAKPGDARHHWPTRCGAP